MVGKQERRYQRMITVVLALISLIMVIPYAWNHHSGNRDWNNDWRDDDTFVCVCTGT